MCINVSVVLTINMDIEQYNMFTNQNKQVFNIIECKYSIPVAARSKAQVCGRSPAQIVGSNTVGGMDVCCECCVMSGRGFCDELITRPEVPFRLWCVVECDNLVNEESLAQWGAVVPKKVKLLIVYSDLQYSFQANISVTYLLRTLF